MTHPHMCSCLVKCTEHAGGLPNIWVDGCSTGAGSGWSMMTVVSPGVTRGAESRVFIGMCVKMPSWESLMGMRRVLEATHQQLRLRMLSDLPRLGRGCISPSHVQCWISENSAGALMRWWLLPPRRNGCGMTLSHHVWRRPKVALWPSVTFRRCQGGEHGMQQWTPHTSMPCKWP